MKFATMVSLALISGAFFSCKTQSVQIDDSSGIKSTNAAKNAGGGYSVSYYEPGQMPIECAPPEGVDKNMAVAIIEGDPAIGGRECGMSGFTGNFPPCSLYIKDLCGTIFTIKNPSNGKQVKAYFSGICPYYHPDNYPKGKWNPCGKDKRAIFGQGHIDMMQSAYTALGLSVNNSWGSDGADNVNPSAATLEIVAIEKKPNVDTCEGIKAWNQQKLGFFKVPCPRDLFPF